MQRPLLVVPLGRALSWGAHTSLGAWLRPVVVDAYMEVQEDHSSTVAKTFRRNLGSLGQDLLNISWRTFYTSWLVMASRLNPMALLQRSKPIFVEWSDDDWLEILARVMEVRRSKGIPSRGTTLATLTREIKKLPHKCVLAHGIPTRAPEPRARVSEIGADFEYCPLAGIARLRIDSLKRGCLPWLARFKTLPA